MKTKFITDHSNGVGADAAAVRAHYWKRLTSLEGWRKLLSGAVDWRKLLLGLRKLFAGLQPSPLAREMGAAMARGGRRAWLILAKDDATAIAAVEELKAPLFKGLIEGRETIPSDSHTFARPGDEAPLLVAVERAMQALET